MNSSESEVPSREEDAEPAIRVLYAARASAARERTGILERRELFVSSLRLGVFVAAVVALAAPGLEGAVRTASLVGGLVLAAGFVTLVFVHRRLTSARDREEGIAALNAVALHRMDRAWRDIPVPLAPAGLRDHPTARDLNLFGRASLFHLLGGGLTPYGRRTLSHWLLEPASPDEVRARQGAVAEMAPRLDERQGIQLLARAFGSAPGEGEAFVTWGEGTGWLRSRRWMPSLAAALTIAFIVAGGAALLGLTTRPYWVLLALVNVVFGWAMMGRIHAVFAQVEAGEGEIRAYRGILERLEALVAKSPRLVQHLGTLHEGRGAQRELLRLERIIGFAEVRFSPMIHLGLQGLFLWDFHVLYLLERWQSRAGPRIRGWTRAMGEVEALMALASAVHDNPDWRLPEITSGGIIEGRELAHPLLPRATRVGNDVEVGPGGSLLFVTGSNMSGKSTLLRAIGVNVTLALAGGPVCAQALRLPPVRLGTSFVVEDSLEDGVSYFMAELRRLKELVVSAESQAESAGPPLLFLLDEILRGTNSGERRIAVRSVVQRLLSHGSLGAISSHDLELGLVERLGDRCRPVHFRETIEDGPDSPIMTFDYRMRPGVAPTTNALVLLRLTGLEEDIDEEV